MIMRRGGGHSNDSAGKGRGVVAVAVDSDKNSQYALRWAGDHLLARGQIFYLLHIRKKITSIPTIHGSMPISDVEEEVAAQFREQRDHQTKELLLPFQCFCTRRQFQCKEVILDEMDVGKGIVDFVMRQSVDKLVVGASNHGPIAGVFIRAFVKPDVPTTVCKTAPDFCSVYVIAKGCKIVSVRPASCPHTSSKRLNNRFSGEIESTGNNTYFQSVKSDPYTRESFEATLLSSSIRQSSDNPHMLKSPYNYRINNRTRWHDADESMRSLESFVSCPSPSCSSIDVNSPPSSRRIRSDQSTNHHNGRLPPPPSSSNNYDHSFYEDTMDDLEAELERLKHEMKKTTELALADKHDWDFKSYLRESRSDSTEEKNRKAIAPMAHRKTTSVPVPETREKRKLIEGFTSDVTYRRYSTDEMDLATDYFSDALKVGEGGYGPVYKATLDDTTVAIKALRSDVSTTQGLKQFQQELEVLSSMTHPNMVRLLGACPEYGCLVYEYMSYGNLEECLECRSETPLPWQLRFRIAFNIATGLLFLHQQTPEPLVHRDLKPANILLDHNLVAKISDVGLARLIPSLPGGSNTTMYHMTAAAGTFCYIDPEYQKTGLVCTKSDVYALGIIFLQLVTGRGPMGLTYNVMNALEANNLADMLDPKVPDWPIDETKRLVELALQCAELRRKDRPDLASVIWPEVMNLAAFAESNHDTEFFMQHYHCHSLKMANSTMDGFAVTSTAKGASLVR